MATHQFPGGEQIGGRKEKANHLSLDSTDHILARHSFAWEEISKGRVPTDAINELLQETRTSKGMPHHANLGWMLSQCQRSREAINRLNKELDDAPDSEDIHLHVGISLQRIKDFRTSEMVLRRLLERSPENLTARKYHAEALMKLGKWSEGIRELEATGNGMSWLQKEYYQDAARLWKGQPIKGRNIVIVGNSKVSDQLLFSRYVDVLRAQEPHMIGISCSTKVLELMRTLPDVARVDDKRFEPYDYFIPMESLPLHLGSTPGTVPSPMVLKRNPKQVQAYRNQLSKSKPLLGICWRNYETYGRSEEELCYEKRAHSPGLEMLFPYLREISNSYDLIAVQPDVSPEEAELLSKLHVRCPAPQLFDDYGKVADFLSSLDEFISVGSPVAHLAGCLDFPARLLLPFVPEWKWDVKDGACHWYPGISAYQKQTENSWSECLDEVFGELQASLELPKAS